jgi:hypothetical protein
MEEEEMKKFSLMALLLVTGFSFLLFGFVLRILDGVDTRLFMGFGLITFISGVVAGTYVLVNKKKRQRKVS